MNFFVAERISAPMIFGCDYADRHIEEIKPRKRVVEMANGKLIATILKLSVVLRIPQLSGGIKLSPAQGMDIEQDSSFKINYFTNGHPNCVTRSTRRVS